MLDDEPKVTTKLEYGIVVTKDSGDPLDVISPSLVTINNIAKMYAHTNPKTYVREVTVMHDEWREMEIHTND